MSPLFSDYRYLFAIQLIFICDFNSANAKTLIEPILFGKWQKGFANVFHIAVGLLYSFLE